MKEELPEIIAPIEGKILFSGSAGQRVARKKIGMKAGEVLERKTDFSGSQKKF